MAIGGNAGWDQELADIDETLKKLQVRFEQYFLGLERRPPTTDRDQLRSRLMVMKRENFRNTALKFKLNSLWNKYLSYERMWNRTLKEMEEGRYHRDVFKAKRHIAAREALEKGQAEAKSPAAAAAAKAAARGGAVEGLSDSHVEKLHKAFVTAKKRCGEDTSGLTLDAMRKSLAKQVPAIKAKHKASSVDFKVVIRGGKAILKAVPK